MLKKVFQALGNVSGLPDSPVCGVWRGQPEVPASAVHRQIQHRQLQHQPSSLFVTMVMITGGIDIGAGDHRSEQYHHRRALERHKAELSGRLWRSPWWSPRWPRRLSGFFVAYCGVQPNGCYAGRRQAASRRVFRHCARWLCGMSATAYHRHRRLSLAKNEAGEFVTAFRASSGRAISSHPDGKRLP